MNRFEKSTAPSASPIGGIRMSVVNDVTIFPNAAPTTKPTARSITLPLIANCLNSESIDTMRPPFVPPVLVRSLAYKSIAARQCKTAGSAEPRIDFAETLLVADVVIAHIQEESRWDQSISRMKSEWVPKLNTNSSLGLSSEALRIRHSRSRLDEPDGRMGRARQARQSRPAPEGHRDRQLRHYSGARRCASLDGAARRRNFRGPALARIHD